LIQILANTGEAKKRVIVEVEGWWLVVGIAMEIDVEIETIERRPGWLHRKAFSITLTYF